MPVGRRWPPRVEGITFYATDEIYLRGCTEALHLVRFWVTVFAHELIHVEHPRWPHFLVYRYDDWYGRAVVGPAIRRERT